MNKLLEELCKKSIETHGFTLLDTVNRREYISGDLIFKDCTPVIGRRFHDRTHWMVRVRGELTVVNHSYDVTDEIAEMADKARIEYRDNRNRSQEIIYRSLLDKFK